MRIVIFSSYFLPHRGGVENYVHQTAKRLVKRGHKVWVVTSQLPGVNASGRIDGISVVRIPSVELLSDRLTIQLSPVSGVFEKVGRVDAVITNTRFYPLSFAAGLYAHRHGVPWLHVEHGTQQSYDNPVIRAGVRTVDAVIGRWILTHSRVAGVSRASCGFSGKLGARKCDVLYNGVDTGFFDGKRKKHRGLRIAFVGRLIKDKGVQDLLRAARGSGAAVVIVGKGPYEGELKKLGGKFVGQKDARGVREVLAGSDILVNPSYGEGLPTAVLEAGAMGLAVVATDVGGTREIIDDKRNGFLVRAGDVKALRDRISMLVKSSKLREKFGRALQKKVRETFDWDETAVKLEKVLKSL
jgi:glycosyltransferase involved in cell wall biosynthesis